MLSGELMPHTHFPENSVKHAINYCGWLILFVVFLLSGVVLADPVDSDHTIVLNTTGKEPLSTPDHQGLMDQLATEAFRRCGYTLMFDALPAERALRNADKGIIDGELARIKGMEKIYPNLIRVPEKLIDWYFVAYSKNPLDLANGWESLAQRNIAFITGWKIFEQNSPESASITKVRNADQLFTLLSRGRTDIALFNLASGNYLVEKLKLKDVKAQMPPLAVREMYIYLNKKHSRLVPILAKSLADMKSDGTYDKILNSGKTAERP